MQFKKFSSFIRGLVANQDYRSKLGDAALLLLHNMDVDVVGRVKRRDGYKNFIDLDEEGSNVSSNGFPVIGGDNPGFDGRVQAIFPFTDLGGKRYLFIVSNGSVYLEEDRVEGGKSWQFLNPTGRVVINDKENHIDIVPYLDTVFINDYKNNILMYDTSLFSTNQTTIVGSSYIYFAGRNIKFRSSTNFDADTDNDITIESSATNIEGNQIYESLKAIGFTGVGGDVPDPANIKFGYSLAIGSVAADYEYFVLENQLNQRGDNTVFLIKFDANLNALEKLSFTIDANANILSFGHHNGFLYLWHKDGQVKRISTDFNSTTLVGQDTIFVAAPTNSSGKKEYRIEANEKGLFLYTYKVPPGIDWYQPIIIEDFNFVEDQKTWTHYNFNSTDKSITTYEQIFAKDLVSETELKINRNYYRKTDVDREAKTNDPIMVGAYSGGFTYGPTIKHAVWDDGGYDVGINQDSSFSSRPKSYSIISTNGESLSFSAKQSSNFGFQVAINTANYRNKGSDLGINNIDFNGLNLGIRGLNLFKYKGVNFSDETVQAPTNAAIYHGHEILSNFNFSKNTNRVNIFSLSSIKDDASDDYHWQDSISGDVRYSNFLKSYIINEDTSNLSESTGGDSQFTKEHLGSLMSENAIKASYMSGNELGYGTSIGSAPDATVNGLYSGDALVSEYDFLMTNFKGWFSSTFKHEFNSVNNISAYQANYSGYTPITYNIDQYREAALYDNTKKKITHHPYFVIDKERIIPSDITLWDSNLDLNQASFYLEGGAYFNPSIFTDRETSNYVLLCGFTHQGAFLTNNYSTLTGTKFWRLMFPLGKITNLKALSPISYTDDKYIYFGNSLVDSIAGRDNGYIYRVNIDKADVDNYLSFEIRETEKAQMRESISGDDNKWFMIQDLGDGDTADIRIGEDWRWGQELGDGSQQAAFSQTDYTDLVDYRSNLVYHINRNPVSQTTTDGDDRLRYIGTPVAPLASAEVIPLAGTMQADDEYRYFLSFQFFSGEITYLSPTSATIKIPDLDGLGGAQKVSIIIDNINLLDSRGVILYETDQVEFIRVYRQQKNNTDTDFQEINFLVVLEKDRSGETSDYYYYVSDGSIYGDNKLPTNGGSGYTAGTKTTTGGAGTGLTVDITVSAGAVTSFNVNANGLGYAIGDVITIDGGTGATYALKENDFAPYEGGKYEDETRVLAKQPFTTDKVQEFPCEHILVHQNRLVLVNDLESGNTNTILYSAIDLAQAVDRGNFRDIESGDGGRLVRGVSMRDFLYLFKDKSIYAIIGDVANGQLIDISKSIGCEFKNMIAEFNNRVYFLNRDGIYMISGRDVVDIERLKLDDFFNENLKASIDFDGLSEHGFSFVNTNSQDIVWHLPLKSDNTNYNTAAIIFNVTTQTFKTYSYGMSVFTHRRVMDVEGGDKVLLGGYNGEIMEESTDNDDNGRAIKYFIKTKSFNAEINSIRKVFNIIKAHGDQLQGAKIECLIDGQEVIGSTSYKQKFNGSGDMTFNIMQRGEANEISIIITGTSFSAPPASISEILLGYSPLKGIN